MRPLKDIASLWIGDRLSWLEQLCLKSFADAGHRVTLYSYDPIDNLPECVNAGDAREIYAPDTVLRHKRTGSPAIHADVWRLHLLAKTDQVWVDADVYCKRAFDAVGDHIFGWEKPGLVCNAVLQLPRSSAALSQLLDFFAEAERSATSDGAQGEARSDVPLSEMKWGATGPGALTQALNDTGEISFAAAQDVYYPVSFRDRNKMLLSRFDIEVWLTEDTRAVHFWARRLKPRLAEKLDNTPRRGSYLDGLLKKHDISTSGAPIPGWKPEKKTSAAVSEAGTLTATQLLVDTLGATRATRVVDVGANPLTPPPYDTLFRMNACHVVGFEPHPEAFAALQDKATERETYFPFAIGDGSDETLHIYNESGLTSVFDPHEGAIHYLGRSRRNIGLREDIPMTTRTLDSIRDLGDVDLLKIDIQGAEVKVFQGAERVLRDVLVVIPEVRFYRLYEDEPMLGGVDTELRRHGFTLHKFTEQKSKVIPNSQINRLNRKNNRNQIIDGDAIYIRDPARIAELSHEKLKHYAILATEVFQSFDLALHVLDVLAERGCVSEDVPARYVDALPAQARKS